MKELRGAGINSPALSLAISRLEQLGLGEQFSLAGLMNSNPESKAKRRKIVNAAKMFTQAKTSTLKGREEWNKNRREGLKKTWGFTDTDVERIEDILDYVNSSAMNAMVYEVLLYVTGVSNRPTKYQKVTDDGLADIIKGAIDLASKVVAKDERGRPIYQLTEGQMLDVIRIWTDDAAGEHYAVRSPYIMELLSEVPNPATGKPTYSSLEVH